MEVARVVVTELDGYIGYDIGMTGCDFDSGSGSGSDSDSGSDSGFGSDSDSEYSEEVGRSDGYCPVRPLDTSSNAAYLLEIFLRMTWIWIIRMRLCLCLSSTGIRSRYYRWQRRRGRRGMLIVL